MHAHCSGLTPWRRDLAELIIKTAQPRVGPRLLPEAARPKAAWPKAARPTADSPRLCGREPDRLGPKAAWPKAAHGPRLTARVCAAAASHTASLPESVAHSGPRQPPAQLQGLTAGAQGSPSSRLGAALALLPPGPEASPWQPSRRQIPRPCPSPGTPRLRALPAHPPTRPLRPR